MIGLRSFSRCKTCDVRCLYGAWRQTNRYEDLKTALRRDVSSSLAMLGECFSLTSWEYRGFSVGPACGHLGRAPREGRCEARDDWELNG